MGVRKEKKHVEMVQLAIQKEIVGDQERNRLHRETMVGAWLSTATHHLNDTELSWE